jgi:hypothetical protein
MVVTNVRYGFGGGGGIALQPGLFIAVTALFCEAIDSP